MKRMLLACIGWMLSAACPLACAQAEAGKAASDAAGFPYRTFDFTAAPVPPASWLRAPRAGGRITSKELGLVINTADA